eukprot:scaffold17746_cov112-Isochrysis_galbana.AAC.4
MVWAGWRIGSRHTRWEVGREVNPEGGRGDVLAYLHLIGEGAATGEGRITRNHLVDEDAKAPPVCTKAVSALHDHLRGQFDVPVGLEHHVLRLEIPKNDPTCVQVAECRDDTRRVEARRVGRGGAVRPGGQVLKQVATQQRLEHQPEVSLGLDGAQQAHHKRVAHLAQQLHLGHDGHLLPVLSHCIAPHQLHTDHLAVGVLAQLHGAVRPLPHHTDDPYNRGRVFVRSRLADGSRRRPRARGGRDSHLAELLRGEADGDTPSECNDRRRARLAVHHRAHAQHFGRRDVAYHGAAELASLRLQLAVDQHVHPVRQLALHVELCACLEGADGRSGREALELLVREHRQVRHVAKQLPYRARIS